MHAAAALRARCAAAVAARDAATGGRTRGDRACGAYPVARPGDDGLRATGAPPERRSHGHLPPAGNVALVSQSGVLNAAMLDWAGDSTIGFSLAVSLGAEADVDVAQVLDFLASDMATRAVVVYLEAVRDARSFMSALRALATVKPVVVLKGGRDRPADRARAPTRARSSPATPSTRRRCAAPARCRCGCSRNCSRRCATWLRATGRSASGWR